MWCNMNLHKVSSQCWRQTPPSPPSAPITAACFMLHLELAMNASILSKITPPPPGLQWKLTVSNGPIISMQPASL